MGTRIPRILHQNFLSGDSEIPSPIRAIRDALRAANPDWSYSFWDAPRAEAFITETYGYEMLARYLRIRPEYYAARSDLLRYLTLYAHGGVYLDIKSTCSRPLDDAIRPDDRFLLMHFSHMMGSTRLPEFDASLLQHQPEIAHLPNGEYVQWAIASVQGHPYLHGVIERVLKNIDGYSPLVFGVGGAGTVRLTGPLAYTLEIESIREAELHSGPMNADDRGFVYSGLGSATGHSRITGKQVYYQHLTGPIVETSSTMMLVTRALKWTTRFGPVASFARHLRAFLLRRCLT